MAFRCAIRRQIPLFFSSSLVFIFQLFILTYSSTNSLSSLEYETWISRSLVGNSTGANVNLNDFIKKFSLSKKSDMPIEENLNDEFQQDAIEDAKIGTKSYSQSARKSYSFNSSKGTTQDTPNSDNQTKRFSYQATSQSLQPNSGDASPSTLSLMNDSTSTSLTHGGNTSKTISGTYAHEVTNKKPELEIGKTISKNTMNSSKLSYMSQETTTAAAAAAPTVPTATLKQPISGHSIKKITAPSSYEDRVPKSLYGEIISYPMKPPRKSVSQKKKVKAHSNVVPGPTKNNEKTADIVNKLTTVEKDKPPSVTQKLPNTKDKPPSVTQKLPNTKVGNSSKESITPQDKPSNRGDQPIMSYHTPTSNSQVHSTSPHTVVEEDDPLPPLRIPIHHNIVGHSRNVTPETLDSTNTTETPTPTTDEPLPPLRIPKLFPNPTTESEIINETDSFFPKEENNTRDFPISEPSSEIITPISEPSSEIITNNKTTIQQKSTDDKPIDTPLLDTSLLDTPTTMPSDMPSDVPSDMPSTAERLKIAMGLQKIIQNQKYDVSYYNDMPSQLNEYESPNMLSGSSLDPSHPSIPCACTCTKQELSDPTKEVIIKYDPDEFDTSEIQKNDSLCYCYCAERAKPLSTTRKLTVLESSSVLENPGHTGFGAILIVVVAGLIAIGLIFVAVVRFKAKDEMELTNELDNTTYVDGDKKYRNVALL